MVNNAAREVYDQLRILRAKAETDAPRAACTAIGQVAETAVKVTLTSSSHQKGTPTPSRPGMPPSLVSGKLRRSVHRTTPVPSGLASYRCAVGAVAKYAPSHEYGVTIRAKNFPVLGNPDVGFFGPQVTLPKRPFMATAVKRLIENDMLSGVASDAWRVAMGL